MTVAHFQAPDAPGFRLDYRVIASVRAVLPAGSGRANRGHRLGAHDGARVLPAPLHRRTVGLNHWNRWFFDSLEARNVEGADPGGVRVLR